MCDGTLSTAKRDNPLSHFAEKNFSVRPVLILVVKFDIALCNVRACLTVTLVFKCLCSPRTVPVYATTALRGDSRCQRWLS